MRFKTVMRHTLRALTACLVLFIGFHAMSAAASGPGSGPGTSPSPTPGASPSPTPGVTPSPTPQNTPSPSPTPTPGASPSPSPGVTPSPSPSPTPDAGRLRIRGTLTGAAFNGMVPSAEVELEAREDGSRRLKIKAENVNVPAGTLLGVLVDGVRVGTITIDGSLRGELELRTERGQAIPEVNTRTRVVVVDATGATVLGGAFSNDGTTPAPSPGFETRIEARLAGAALNGLTPKGHARFRLTDAGRRKLNVEVEKVNLPAGTVLSVLVDGAKVGEIVLRQTLENELELDTNNNQFVPQVTSSTRVVVANAQGATIVSGTFNTSVAPISGRDIDDAQFFVEQQYRDFFDREADDSGLGFWKGQLSACGDDRPCVERSRINTSGAFFLSIEFQSTGYLLYRLNKASFGAVPRRADFLLDMQRATAGLVVGRDGWEQQLEANKRALVEDWVSRAAFRGRFGALSNAQFVDALFAGAGITPAAGERDALVAGLDGGTETRATVLRKVAESPALVRQEKNAAFVLMQYFGYLHRDPDDAGFQFWLRKLNQFGGDFHGAEMVKAFIVSGEYRDRFDW